MSQPIDPAGDGIWGVIGLLLFLGIFLLASFHALRRGNRERFREVQGREPGPPVCCDFTYCHPDPARA